jgi:hypothetical protein
LLPFSSVDEEKGIEVIEDLIGWSGIADLVEFLKKYVQFLVEKGI